MNTISRTTTTRHAGHDQSACARRPGGFWHARRSGGFTLIEMSIVVTIAAILASVALPGVFGQLRKARRWEAMTSIVRVQQTQERWRGGNAAYAPTLATLASIDPSLAAATGNGYYMLATEAAADAADTGYTVTATAVAGSPQAADSACTRLTVTVNGGNADYGPANCWSR